MNLWIRSQDKIGLTKIDNICVMDNRIVFIPNSQYGRVTLGTYKTKQRALEVLDEIQNAVSGIITIEDVKEQNKKQYTGEALASKITQNIVYEMPKE